MCFIRDRINAFFPLIDEWEVIPNAVHPALKATILAHPVVSLLVIYFDFIVSLSASMSIQEKILMKNIEERLTSLAVVVASGQALHLCRVAR